MLREQTPVRGFSPFYSQHTAKLGRGGQIKWSRVPDEFFQKGTFPISINGAVAKGVTSLTVDALPYPVYQGDILRGADVKSVTVTVDVAGAAANATSVPVTALSAAIPSGTLLDFGTKKVARLSAAAAAGATSLTVDAIPTALVSGDVATYQGGEKNIEVTADAAAGATTISVAKIQFPLADNEEIEGDYTNPSDKKFIPIGTIMVRDTDGFLIPRSALLSTDTETACGFLASDAEENSRTDSRSGYGLVTGGTDIWQNLLAASDQTAGAVNATYKSELVANGVNVQYITWGDSRTV